MESHIEYLSSGLCEKKTGKGLYESVKPDLGGSETKSKGGGNKDWCRVLVLLRRRGAM